MSLQPPGQLFDVYIVIRAESTVAGAAYRLNAPWQLILIPVTFGPSGDGLHIANDYGDWVGFGECAVGYGGQPMIVAHYQLAFYVEDRATYVIRIEGNVLEDPRWPVMADCANQILPCAPREFVIWDPVATSTKSFGGVKALYAN